MNIARNIKAVEALKAQMVIQSGELIKAIALNPGGTQATEHAAGLLVSVYILLMRLGVSPLTLDIEIEKAIMQNLDSASELQPQLEELARHFSLKNDDD